MVQFTVGGRLNANVSSTETSRVNLLCIDVVCMPHHSRMSPPTTVSAFNFLQINAFSFAHRTCKSNECVVDTEYHYHVRENFANYTVR